MIAVFTFQLVACEDVVDSVQNTIVEQHRSEARGRAGVLRALEVSDSAFAITRHINYKGDPLCGAFLDGTLRAQVEVQLELIDPSGKRVALLEEVRTFERDAEGDVRAHWTSDFADETSGRHDVLERDERIVGGELFVKEHNLASVSRRARPDDVAQLEARVRDATPAIVEAAGATWRQQGASHTWVAEEGTPGRSLRCGFDRFESGWIHRLTTRTELSLARLEHDPANKRLSVSARLSTLDERPFVLRAEIEESIVSQDPSTIAVDVPTGKIASTWRDRPYRDIEIILGERLKLEGWR